MSSEFSFEAVLLQFAVRDVSNVFADKSRLFRAFLKMRNINLAYHLPEAVCKKLHVGDTRLTFQVNNLFYVCAAGNGIDPESYGFNTGSRNLSQPKTFSIGLSTSF